MTTTAPGLATVCEMLHRRAATEIADAKNIRKAVAAIEFITSHMADDMHHGIFLARGVMLIVAPELRDCEELDHALRVARGMAPRGA